MKFFLFNISEVTLGSERASDSGIGISAFTVPANKLCNITSSKGFINMTFDNAGIYEESFMNEGEAREKVNVSIASKDGQELDLITEILNFITSTTGNPVLKFDAISKTSSVRSSNINSSSDILAKISTIPIDMGTGRIAIGNKEQQYQNTIAGINFKGNLPSLDFNHEGLAGFADGAEITSWKNAGTLGSTHSIVANVSSPSCETDAATSGINQKSALLSTGEHFLIPNSFTVTEDYTLYCVLGVSVRPMILYGDSTGETAGFGGGQVSGAITSSNLGSVKPHSFTVRHSGMTGAAATVQTNNTDNGTSNYRWPDYYESESDVSEMDVDVFIIRRDKENNMYLHNRDGSIIGFIPEKSLKTDYTLLTTSTGRTDGDLLIQELGTSGGVDLASNLYFRGYISRFGVIPHDIGASKSSTLAQDLFEFYNP
jgi:hypothetical protein